MRRSLRFPIVLFSMLIIAHRSPAPIVEENPTPAHERVAKSKPKRTAESKSSSSAAKPRATPAPLPTRRFAGTWAGVTQTFPWGDISQTITVDSTETTMTMVSTNGPDAGSPRTVKAERESDTLKGNFGNRGVYSLTPLADGSTALVRLQALFNDNTASYHRTGAVSTTTKPAK